jgi:signal transduction histidine kinase
MNAMPDGGTLALFLERCCAEFLVGIVDTGHGIPKDDIENIFDPFYTRAPVGKGTGLGLSICYSILKQHSGSLQVESVQDKGSTFVVKLPTAED